MCNLACGHCNYHSELPVPNNIFVSKKMIEIVLNWLATNGFKEIRFSGGEPLLTPNIEYWISEALMRGFFVTIMTNGTIWGPRERDILFSVHRVFVSLYSMNHNIHEEVTSRKWAYKKTLKTITQLCQEKQHVAIQFCINRFNYSDVVRLLQWASKIGVGQIKILSLTENHKNSNFFSNFCINEIEKQNFWESLKKSYSEFPKVEIRVAMPLLSDTILSTITPRDCFLKYDEFLWSIYPNGTISPCCLLNSDSNNLRLLDSYFNIKPLNSIKNKYSHQMKIVNSNIEITCHCGELKKIFFPSGGHKHYSIASCPLRFFTFNVGPDNEKRVVV